jgi:cell division protein FtsW (lipid II flippase)
MLLKLSSTLLVVTNVAILIFGMVMVVYPQSASPNDGQLLRSLGAAAVGMGLFGAMISVVPYRQKQRWSWFTLWYLPVFWTGHLVGQLPPSNDQVHQYALIAASILGLMLPVREFFPGDDTRADAG